MPSHPTACTAFSWLAKRDARVAILTAFVSLDVGRACGERVWGCVHCAGDGHVAHPVSAGDVDQGLTFIVTLASFLALVGIEFEWAAHMHTAGLGAGATFTGSGANKLAFEFGQAAKDGED